MTANFLTFDIEDWYHSNFKSLDLSKVDKSRTNFRENVSRLIDICEKHKVKSTCFVVGSMAEKYPDIIRKLHDNGHEIASHTYSHNLVYSMTESEFRQDLLKSKDILENIIGSSIYGFRAPSWSVRNDMLHWYYNILTDLGFKYSSSVYPAKTFLYGIPGFEPKPHYPLVSDKQVQILEVPVPVFGCAGKKIGFSGGFYLRALPGPLIKVLINKKNRNNVPVFIYLHPREIDKMQERLNLPYLEKFIYYWGIARCEKKFDSLVARYKSSFSRIVDYIGVSNL